MSAAPTPMIMPASLPEIPEAFHLGSDELPFADDFDAPVGGRVRYAGTP